MFVNRRQWCLIAIMVNGDECATMVNPGWCCSESTHLWLSWLLTLTDHCEWRLIIKVAGPWNTFLERIHWWCSMMFANNGCCFMIIYSRWCCPWWSYYWCVQLLSRFGFILFEWLLVRRKKWIVTFNDDDCSCSGGSSSKCWCRWYCFVMSGSGGGGGGKHEMIW